MQAFLKKHGSGHSEHGIKVSWTLMDGVLRAEFEVKKRNSKPWHTDELFTADWAKNWGLWNKDVVEVFLQKRGHSADESAPYLELQVSPLNQPFALVITEPRVNFHPPKALELRTESQVEGRIWKSSFEVRLPAELRGTLLYGGFFACLDSQPREFYALEPNPESQPDFHRPSLFLNLDQ